VRAADDVLDLVPGPFGLDLGGGQDAGRGAQGALHGGVVAQDLGEGLVVGEVKVAEAAERDLGGLGVLHPVAEMVDELGGEAGDEDVHRRAELLADRGVGERRGGLGVGRVALDHEDAAPEGGVSGQPPGDRGADHGAADDDHVVGGVLGGHGSHP
jgi:hypothetical protein